MRIAHDLFAQDRDVRRVLIIIEQIFKYMIAETLGYFMVRAFGVVEITRVAGIFMEYLCLIGAWLDERDVDTERL